MNIKTKIKTSMKRIESDLKKTESPEASKNLSSLVFALKTILNELQKQIKNEALKEKDEIKKKTDSEIKMQKKLTLDEKFTPDDIQIDKPNWLKPYVEFETTERLFKYKATHYDAPQLNKELTKAINASLKDANIKIDGELDIIAPDEAQWLDKPDRRIEYYVKKFKQMLLEKAEEDGIEYAPEILRALAREKAERYLYDKDLKNMNIKNLKKRLASGDNEDSQRAKRLQNMMGSQKFWAQKKSKTFEKVNALIEKKEREIAVKSGIKLNKPLRFYNYNNIIQAKKKYVLRRVGSRKNMITAKAVSQVFDIEDMVLLGS